MSERLTDAEYEPIRSALFDGPSGQGAEAAKRKIARDNLSAQERKAQDEKIKRDLASDRVQTEFRVDGEWVVQ